MAILTKALPLIIKYDFRAAHTSKLPTVTLESYFTFVEPCIRLTTVLVEPNDVSNLPSNDKTIGQATVLGYLG